MSEKSSGTNKSFSLDWLIQGVLTKLGEIFDGFTGRKWKPSSSLATSELIERLKFLLDTEVQDLGARGKFVPHNLKLKMQWDKFSTDAENALKKLENELLIAAADHINDRRYHTYAPLRLEVKPDYFTEGVKLLASFEKFTDEDGEAEMNVTLSSIKPGELNIAPTAVLNNDKETFIAHFTVDNTAQKVKLRFQKKQRLSVGRSKENDLTIADTSVSKVHASLILNAENNLVVADTGSTNGTFINGERISYGKAMLIGENDKVSFGSIDVLFEYVPKPIENSVTINGLEFISKADLKDEYESELSNRTTIELAPDLIKKK
jgi:pSer/pThr/pTyr-binding forkhead associated (FHA) protein